MVTPSEADPERLPRRQVVVGCMFFQHRMKLLDKIGREFSGYNILASGKRPLDRKPLQCSLYALSLPSLVALSGFFLITAVILSLAGVATGISQAGDDAPYS
jgi:hypothetical protein